MLAEDAPAHILGQYRFDIGMHAFAQLRQGVKHSGDEHVAGNTADGIEVDMANLSHAGYPCTGTT